MKKIYPPIKPRPLYKPTRREFIQLDDNKSIKIYDDIVDNRDGDFSLKEEFEDMEEEFPEPPKIRYWENLSIQDIVDLAPIGTKLCDIILSVYMPRDLSYTRVLFVKYDRNLELEEKRYKEALIKYEQDLKKYNQELEKYNQELEKYNILVKEQEILELEEKLSKLKNEIAKN